MDAIAEDYHLKGKEVDAEPATEVARKFSSQLKISRQIAGKAEVKFEDGQVEDDEYAFRGQAVNEDEDGGASDEEEFSFAYARDDVSQIAAEDAFFNGQIRPAYPLFNRDLLLGDGNLEGLNEKPPVKNVFVKMNESTSSASGNDDTEWSGEAVETSGPDGCKKSNSTGFSKFWRFRDLLNRSNSDGRDAFVFLNNPAPSTSAAAGKIEEKKSNIYSQKKMTGEAKVNAGENTSRKKKSKKVVSAHERYMKSKAKEDDRRRSYLPYRPELVGFFTNVKGGLTKNVHPF